MWQSRQRRPSRTGAFAGLTLAGARSRRGADSNTHASSHFPQSGWTARSSSASPWMSGAYSALAESNKGHHLHPSAPYPDEGRPLQRPTYSQSPPKLGLVHWLPGRNFPPEHPIQWSTIRHYDVTGKESPSTMCEHPEQWERCTRPIWTRCRTESPAKMGRYRLQTIKYPPDQLVRWIF